MEVDPKVARDPPALLFLTAHAQPFSVILILLF